MIAENTDVMLTIVSLVILYFMATTNYITHKINKRSNINSIWEVRFAGFFVVLATAFVSWVLAWAYTLLDLTTNAIVQAL